MREAGYREAGRDSGDGRERRSTRTHTAHPGAETALTGEASDLPEVASRSPSIAHRRALHVPPVPPGGAFPPLSALCSSADAHQQDQLHIHNIAAHDKYSTSIPASSSPLTWPDFHSGRSRGYAASTRRDSATKHSVILITHSSMHATRCSHTPKVAAVTATPDMATKGTPRVASSAWG